jgi:hypothetical protein
MNLISSQKLSLSGLCSTVTILDLINIQNSLVTWKVTHGSSMNKRPGLTSLKLCVISDGSEEC